MKAIMGFGFFLLFLAGIALVMLQGREMARQNMPAGGSRNYRPGMETRGYRRQCSNG